MTTLPPYCCCGLFPYRFTLPSTGDPYAVVVAVFIQIGTTNTYTLFFYSKQHVSTFVSEEWSKLDQPSLTTLVSLARHSDFLPEQSSLTDHEVQNAGTAVFSVLSTCLAHLPAPPVCPLAPPPHLLPL